jgi:hypothetical protein
MVRERGANVYDGPSQPHQAAIYDSSRVHYFSIVYDEEVWSSMGKRLKCPGLLPATI